MGEPVRWSSSYLAESEPHADVLRPVLHEERDGVPLLEPLLREVVPDLIALLLDLFKGREEGWDQERKLIPLRREGRVGVETEASACPLILTSLKVQISSSK